jgi:hypothetical protein
MGGINHIVLFSLHHLHSLHTLGHYSTPKSHVTFTSNNIIMVMNVGCCFDLGPTPWTMTNARPSMMSASATQREPGTQRPPMSHKQRTMLDSIGWPPVSTSGKRPKKATRIESPKQGKDAQTPQRPDHVVRETRNHQSCLPCIESRPETPFPSGFMYPSTSTSPPPKATGAQYAGPWLNWGPELRGRNRSSMRRA